MFKVLRSGLLPCILHTLLQRGLLRYRLHTCPKLWCNPCSKCYQIGCLAAYFTHVQSCDVTLVQSAICSGLLPYILHIRTSCSTVESYLHLQAVASRKDVTCRSCRGQGVSRPVPSRQDVTGAAVDKEAVASRHVTSGRNGCRRGQGGRHVTSRHVRTSQAPPWTRMRSRHVRTSGAVVDKEAVASRHVTRRQGGRHVTSRRQAPPDRTMLFFLYIILIIRSCLINISLKIR